MTHGRADLPYAIVRGQNTIRFGYNTSDARIFKGDQTNARYYIPGIGSYDLSSKTWEHYPAGIAQIRDNVLNYTIKDHLTNIRAIVGTTATCTTPGTITAYDYYPYGKILRKYESVESRYKSTNHEKDSETGYDDRNARFYDDEALRFVQVDQLAHERVSWTPYNFCRNNPINNIDPTGNDWYKHDESGGMFWNDGDDESMKRGELTYKNIGKTTSFSKTLADGNTYNYSGNTDGTTSLIDGSSNTINKADVIHFAADVGMSYGYNSLMRTSLYLDKLSTMGDDIGRGLLTSRTEVAMGRFNAMMETRAALDPIGRIFSGGLKSEQAALGQANRFINSNRPLMDAVRTRGWVNHLARFGKYRGPVLTVGAYGFQTYEIIQNPAVENVRDMNNSVFNPGFWMYQNVFEPYILMPMFPELKSEK
jgi:RHS repeat-associated protein